MGCTRTPIPGGVVFSCTRGFDDRVECKFCKTRVREFVLCDWKLKGEKAGQTCDAVMCRRCATKVGEDKDLCPPHARVWDKDPRNPKNKDLLMAKRDRDLCELPVGVEVMLILTEVSGTKSKSGERRRVLGVGRGRIVARMPTKDTAEDIIYRVMLERSSEAHMVGREMEMSRGWIYAFDLPEERRAFEEAVQLFWRKDRG